MDFARSRPHTGTGSRCGAALASVPANTAASEGPPRPPPATPGAARATPPTGLPGLPGCFSLWGRLRGVVAGVAGRLLLSPVCWRNSKWWCSATPPGGSHQSTDRTAKPRGTATSCRPHRKTLEGRAVATENPEAALEAVPGARDSTPPPPPPRLPGATDGNHEESTGTYSNRTLGGTDFRVEPPEHTSCSLLRSRRCSDPNPAPVGDTDWLWFQVIGQKRDSRQVRRKHLGSNSASSPPQIPVPRGKPCRQESHIGGDAAG